jgi:hypothetical protein
MKVIARLSVLEATESVTAPPESPERLIPGTSVIPVIRVVPAELDIPAEPVIAAAHVILDEPIIPAELGAPTVSAGPLPHRPPAIASVRFPLRSVVSLVLLAAMTWTAAWWNDRQRADADRVLQASLETRAQLRPERLARELSSGAPLPASVQP